MGKSTRGRIGRRFRESAAKNRAALVTFITSGDPGPDATVPLMHALAKAGADLIELGVPFSDPMADGPIIQRASTRALAYGETLRDVLTRVGAFREHNGTTPVVLMGYTNPVEQYGYDQFARDAVDAGVDGLLLVDLPADAWNSHAGPLRAQGLDTIFLLAPTTSRQRIEQIVAATSGFLYYVSVKGVTGGPVPVLNEVATRIGEVRQLTSLPIGVGFGIRSAQQAAEVARFADAVVIGSALVETVEAAEHRQASLAELSRDLADQVASYRTAMDSAREVVR